jgi:hypothetical protein
MVRHRVAAGQQYMSQPSSAVRLWSSTSCKLDLHFHDKFQKGLFGPTILHPSSDDDAVSTHLCLMTSSDNRQRVLPCKIDGYAQPAKAVFQVEMADNFVMAVA